MALQASTEAKQFKGEFPLLAKGGGLDSGGTGRDCELPPALTEVENPSLPPRAILHLDGKGQPLLSDLMIQKDFYTS